MVLITYFCYNIASETLNLMKDQLMFEKDSVTIYPDNTKTEKNGASIEKNIRNIVDIDIITMLSFIWKDINLNSN
jgi:hypothetical protein